MENNTEITNNIINTINTIFENLFSSIDNNLYGVLDDLVFVNKNILNDKYFSKLFGTSTANGILLIANSLLIGILLYYAAKYMISNFTYEKTENPFQFVFKCIIFGICMNCSFFIIEQILDLNNNVCSLIIGIGEDLWGKDICFTGLITEINDAINHRIDFLKNKHGEPFFSFGKHRLGEFDKIKELNANKENQYKTLKDQIVRFEKHQHEYTDDDKATTNAYSDIMNDNLGENIKKFLNEKPGIGWHVTQSGNPINQRNQNDDEKYNQSVKKDYAYWWFECQEEQFKSNPFSISIFIDSKGVRVKLELNNNESNEYTQMLMEKYTQMLKEKNKENEYKTEYEPGKDYANSIIDSFDKLIIHYKEVVNNMSIIQDKIGQAFSEGKKQIVLTGAPGTGKTHAARKYASDMIKQEMESESEDKIKKEQKRRIKFVQFHPSFDYTDFV